MTYTASVNNGLYSADAVEPLGIPGVARQLAATATSASTTLTANISRISIRARFADIRFVVGIGTQTASATTSHFIANGERLDIAVPFGASIGVIRESAATVNGSLAVSELV
jgi:hypothetical protein